MRRVLPVLALAALAAAALIAYGRRTTRRRDLESAVSVSTCDWCGRQFSTAEATYAGIFPVPGTKDSGQNGIFCSHKHSEKWRASLGRNG